MDPGNENQSPETSEKCRNFGGFQQFMGFSEDNSLMLMIDQW